MKIIELILIFYAFISNNSVIAQHITLNTTSKNVSEAIPVLIRYNSPSPQPVLAQPVLAQPVLAQQVLAQQVLAQPVLAEQQNFILLPTPTPTPSPINLIYLTPTCQHMF
jgi:hypothetical protein